MTEQEFLVKWRRAITEKTGHVFTPKEVDAIQDKADQAYARVIADEYLAILLNKAATEYEGDTARNQFDTLLEAANSLVQQLGGCHCGWSKEKGHEAECPVGIVEQFND